MMRATSYFAREDAAVTAFGLFMTLAMIAVGGIGLDVASAVRAKTQLQIAADSAAHAALVARNDQNKSEYDAAAIGLSVAQAALSGATFKEAIKASDIKFGTWDKKTQTFTIQPGSRTAVMVDTKLIAARSNSLATHFLHFVGVGAIDVVSAAVFEIYYPTCFLEGFVAENRVDVQSNNTYGNGFCIHSNDHVEINNGNTFLPGTIVSMPNRTDFVQPSSGAGANPGIENALRDGAYWIGILDDFDEIAAGVTDPDSKWFRTAYVDIDPLTKKAEVTTLAANASIQQSDWVPGNVHKLNCTSDKKKIAFGKAKDVFTKGVLITNCIVQFAQGVELQDLIILNTNEDDEAFSAASGFTLGKDDSCAPGGGAQLLTLGGMNFPSDLQVYGGQLIAAKTVKFAARADGIEGISVVSGDTIDGSSLINVGFCGGLGMGNNFQEPYYRLAI